MLALAALVFVSTGAAPQDQEKEPRKIDKKQLEAQAKQIIAEGKALEQQGKLAEAEDKYVDAEGVLSTKEALSGIKRTREAKDQKVSALLASTHHTYDEAQFADCTAQLEEGLKIEPANGPVHYDLAACYSKLADRARALDHLDQSIGGA
jgi:tetratricopeptide (TPR) repeat protein